MEGNPRNKGSSSAISNLELLNQYFETSYQLLSSGLNFDEKNQTSQASDYYLEGLKIIQQAKQLTFKPGPEREQAQPLLDKLAKNERLFSSRMEEIQQKKAQKNQRTPSHSTVQPRHAGAPNTIVSNTTNLSSPKQSGLMSYLWKIFDVPKNSRSNQHSGILPNNNYHYQQQQQQQQHHHHHHPQQQQSHHKYSLHGPEAQQQSHQSSFYNPKNVPSSSIPSSVALPNQSYSKANAAKPVINVNNIPEFKGVDKKLIDHILNEVMESNPGILWDDIAGLEDAKQTLYETIILPSLRPDIFHGLRSPSKGILLFGPPGNGKTMIAKAVASQCKSKFFSISASALVSKWHGEGEKLVRALFAAARYLQPSVIFIDEVDSILSARSANEHEASRRMKTEFLVQMDGATVSKDEHILVLGATNLPQELDEAVLRRFTKRICIPLPDHKARKALVSHLMKNQSTKLSNADLNDIAKLTKGYSGSDLASLCREACMIPVRELGTKILQVNANAVRPINLSDFQVATYAIKPSVSKHALQKLEEWNAEYGSFSK